MTARNSQTDNKKEGKPTNTVSDGTAAATIISDLLSECAKEPSQHPISPSTAYEEDDDALLLRCPVLISRRGGFFRNSQFLKPVSIILIF